ncbi:Gfo/Idh/MocA family oxidoreductase [Vallitaleaceae bacterium 9-2]
MKTIGYAIVGTGYFGAELGRIMESLEGAKIVAVYDPDNGDVVAKELQCDVETDLDCLFSRQDVEAVIVASPNYLHKEPVIKAAKHGVHVFCEKPIALSYSDCDSMVNACDEHNVIFMAGHVMNFFRGVRHAKKLINDGVIGDILYCHAARNGWEEKQPNISWKKNREKSGGHLYHHIHELDCIQFIMGQPQNVVMTGGNVAHHGEGYGDEDDMLFINLEFENKRYALLEYGSAFRWSEHYVLIQGTKGAIRIDMQDVKMTLKIGDSEEYFLVHETQEEDDDRTRIYKGLEMDGAIMYGQPGKKPPMWLHGIMKNEMKFFNELMHGKEVDDEFKPLLTGEAARMAIATADALTLSLQENRKVALTEIYHG